MRAEAMRLRAGLLLEQQGAPAILRRTPLTYDPATGTATPGTPTDAAVVAHLRTVRDDLVDGTRIRAGDRLAIIAAKGLTLTPQVGDTLYEGDDPVTAPAFTVVEIRPRTVGLTPVAYELLVRR